MDEYGQVGPDKPGYQFDVERIRDQLDNLLPVALAFAAASTKKHVLLVRFAACTILARPEGFSESDPLFVGIAGGQAAWMPTEHWLHPAYVGQYLGHHWGWRDTSDVRSEPFARFLNDVLGHDYPEAS